MISLDHYNKMADYLINLPFCSDDSLDLMKSSEFRKAGDPSNRELWGCSSQLAAQFYMSYARGNNIQLGRSKNVVKMNNVLSE